MTKKSLTQRTINGETVATQPWVQGQLGGASSAAVQTGAPSNPATGALWFDTDEPDAAAIPAGLVDAKGDLLVGTADDTVARQGIGSDNQILTADSTQTTGMKWAAAPTTGPDYLLSTDYSSTDPSNPSTGMRLFARYRARRLLSMVGPDGQDSQVQPSFFSNRISRWSAVNNSTTPTVDGLAVTNTTSPAAIANATTNFFASMIRTRFSSVSSAGSGCGLRSAGAQWFLSSTANMGGFFFVCRVGLAATSATNRVFVGLSTTTAALSPTVDPTTFLSMVGFGCNSADANLKFMSNDASGNATTVDLGSSFPTQTAATYFYEFRLFAPSGAGSNVYWSAHRLNDDAVSQGQATTDLPALNSLLAAHVHHSNGTTTGAVSIDLQTLYLETDN